MTHRYGKLQDGEFKGKIIVTDAPWSDHVAAKMFSAKTALPIVTDEIVPQHSEYYLRTGPTYTVESECIVEKYEWVILPNINEIFRLKIDAVRQAKRELGLKWSFSEGDDIIQLRDNTDIQNIQGLVSSAYMKENAGVKEAVLILRGESDINHAITPAEMIAIGQAVETYVGKLYYHAWSLKDQIGDSNDLELCLALDIETGWPDNK